MKIYAAGAAIIAGLGLALTLTGRAYIGAREDLRAARIHAEQLDGQLTAMVERSARGEAARLVGEQYRIGVANESSNTEWGAAGVPSGVVGRLCERANCVHIPPLPPSGDQSD